MDLRIFFAQFGLSEAKNETRAEQNGHEASQGPSSHHGTAHDSIHGSSGLLQHCGQLFCQRHRRGSGRGGACPDPGLSHPDADGCSGGGNWNWRQRLDLPISWYEQPGKGQPAGRQRDFFGCLHLRPLSPLRSVPSAGLFAHTDRGALGLGAGGAIPLHCLHLVSGLQPVYDL